MEAERKKTTYKEKSYKLDINYPNFEIKQETQMVNVHSGAITIENSVSLLSRKAWFYMVYRAFPYFKESEKFYISLKELKEAIGYDSGNNKYLKESLKELAGVLVEWNILKKDKKVWEVNTMLSGCKIEDGSGICEYSFSPFLKDRLSDPEMYVKLNLYLSRMFKSKYSLAIYSLALDYLQVKINFGSKNLTIDELRKFLGLKNDECIRVVDIHKDILKKVEKEINENSDINLSIQPIRTTNRKITGFKLEMSIKEEYLEHYKPINIDNYKKIEIKQMSLPIDQVIGKQNQVKITSDVLKRFYADNNISLTPKTIQEKLEELRDGLGPKLDDYLIFLMEYTKQEFKKSKVKNIAGFYVGLVKDDSQMINYFVELEEEENKTKEKSERINIILEERLKKKYTSEMFEDFTNYLLMNQDNLEEKITELLNENLRDKNQFVYDMLIKQFGELDIRALTESSFAIKSAVVGFLKNYKEELEYPETSFEYWREKIFKEEGVRKLREEIERGLKVR
jgi:hypothetical protein